MAPFKAISGAGAAGVGLQPHAPSYWRWRSRSTSKATADYHSSLLDREDRGRCWDDRPDHDACPPRPRTSHVPSASRSTHLTTTTTTTTPASGTAQGGGRSSWALRRPSSSKSTKKSNPFRSDDAPDLPPIAAEFSRRELAEFSALPIAIRRKYFCTLDQRRFAQTSTTLDDTDYNNPTGSDLFSDQATAPTAPPRSSQPCPSPLHQSHAVCADPVPLKGASPKPWQQQQEPLTREEQFVLARQLRQSVLLDAAEEAIYKTGQQAPRYLSPPLQTPTLSSTRPSMESQLSDTREPPAPSRPRPRQGRDNFYDSFRWLEEDDGLDLSLHLDDYHANLRDTVPVPAKEHRPSFRRHLSVNKIPFGRPSMTTSRPATEESTIMTTTSPTTAAPSSAAPPSAVASSAALPPFAPQPHARRKSRALSLISPRHGAHSSVTSIDPDAAHYQDPEAREKVRLYLGSSQKFDEAVAYGFPANDRALPRASSEPLRRRQSGQVLGGGGEKVETFFSDDHSSTYSEGFSVADPDTPMTPRTPERLGAKPPTAPSEEGQGPRRAATVGAPEAPLGSREMTLRMTLTRPDLRACEDQIYGWQQKAANPRSSRMSQASGWREDFTSGGGGGYTTGTGQPKENYERFFADLDDETNAPTGGDGNAVKRLWQRVRRGPRERAKSKSSVTGS